MRLTISVDRASPSTSSAMMKSGLELCSAFSSSTPAPTPGAPRAVRPSSDLITQEQLLTRSYTNLYEAVRALHGGWLTGRGADSFRASSQVLVYRDGMRAGGVEALRSMNVREVGYVRYYNGNDATARWGMGHGQGVIFVSSRPL